MEENYFEEAERALGNAEAKAFTATQTVAIFLVKAIVYALFQIAANIANSQRR